MLDQTKPIMTNSGCCTARMQAWNFQADGPFPFDNCIDRTTDSARRDFVISQERLIERLVSEILLAK